MTTLKQALEHRDAIVDVMQGDDAFEDIETDGLTDMIEALMRCGFIVEPDPAIAAAPTPEPAPRWENYRIIPSEIGTAAEEYVRTTRKIPDTVEVRILEIGLWDPNPTFPPRIKYRADDRPEPVYIDWLEQ